MSRYDYLFEDEETKLFSVWMIVSRTPFKKRDIWISQGDPALKSPPNSFPPGHSYQGPVYSGHCLDASDTVESQPKGAAGAEGSDQITTYSMLNKHVSKIAK